MPQGDGAGPLGKGPGVGRGQGICNRDPKNRGGGNRQGRSRNQAAGNRQDRDGQDRDGQGGRRQPDKDTR